MALPVDKFNLIKPLTQSKSFGSNLITTIIVPILWPFLPLSWRAADWMPACITAWSLITNAIFRELTRRRAINILTRWERDLGFTDTNRD